MNLKGLDLNLLVALDALLEQRHVSRAAIKLHVTQPAMSACLHKLRAHFKDPLLAPVGRQLYLTPLAEEIAGQVRSILTQVEGLLHARPSFEPSSAQYIFRIMASDYGMTVVVAALMRRLSRLAPRVGVEVIPFSDSPAKSLSEAHVDFLLITRDFLADKHPMVELVEDSFVCVGWRGNPALREHLTLAQFLDTGHVAVKYGETSIPHVAERFFMDRGIERRIEVTVNGFNAVPHLVVGTDRISLMHARLAAVFARQMPIKLFVPPTPVPKVRLSLQWHSLRNNDRAHQWFRQQFRETAKEIREIDAPPQELGSGMEWPVGRVAPWQPDDDTSP